MRLPFAAIVFCFAAPAGAIPSGDMPAPRPINASFISASPEWGAAFLNFGRWLNTDAGKQLVALDPHLTQLSALGWDGEPERMAIGLMALHLPADFHRTLADVASLPIEQQKEVIAAVSAARRAATISTDGHLRLGVLPRSAQALMEKTLALANNFRYCSFSTLEADPVGLGEPIINEQPGAESDLEFKHIVREIPGRKDRTFHHDYSFLALEATPPGRYEIAFPAGSRVSFAINVNPENRVSLEDRQKLVQKSIQKSFKDILNKPNSALPFGSGVPDVVRRFMTSHYSVMRKRLDLYETYLRDDPVIDDATRAAKMAEMGAIKKLYEEVIGGRSLYRKLSVIITQFSIREKPVLDEYRRYVSADPKHGRTFVEMHLEQMMRYQAAIKDVRDVYSKIDEDRPFSVFEWILGKAIRAWIRIKSARIMIPERPQAVTNNPQLPFARSVPYQSRAFLSAAHGFLQSLGSGVERYIKNDPALDEPSRSEKLKKLAYVRKFVDQRIAVEGLNWSTASMATHILSQGWRELSGDYKSYIRKDGNLDLRAAHSRIKLAENFNSLLEKSSPASAPNNR